MRKLTISRKTMGPYGDYATLKIFVEDYNGKPDTIIKGAPCRLLGKIGQNETKTFEIDEREQKIYAIMGMAGRNYKYDYRIIEAGSEDVSLSGRSGADRHMGCLFYFDGDTPPEVNEDLKKWGRIMGITVVGLALGICVIVFMIQTLIKYLI